MTLFKTISLAALSVLFYVSCSSSGNDKKNTKKRTKKDEVSDSLMLVYDKKNEDPYIAEFMQNLHKKYGFNGNALVAKKGKIIFEGSFGWANYLLRDSLKVKSEFELASITKTFTGVAIMQLLEEGKIALDDDVKKYYPDFPYDGITIRLLLSHRSGMMNYVYFIDDIWRKEKRDMRKGVTNDEVMHIIGQYKPGRYTAPDKTFHYNNSNFMVLGAIIEKITGKSYAEYVMEHIFKPAGMKNSHVYSTAVYDKIPVDVVGHDRTWRYSVAQNFLDGPVGDKGIYSTLHDLVLYDHALKNGRLLTQQSMDSMFMGRNKPLNGHFNYGFGWRIFDGNNGEKVVYHTGWWHGFRNIYVRDLNNDIVVVFLGNLTNGSLLHLDDLYKHLNMPVIRRGAYGRDGNTDLD
ncbi:serine hydrolase domain-containing protein [Pseudopedobacter beijingensis]|uniref:Serine hydrolase domain-containing protein n=1 Tax=Pseudopedobacter beijingensis TaxID=1207056 RepID=A0ABW4I8A6_9SPHI